MVPSEKRRGGSEGDTMDLQEGVSPEDEGNREVNEGRRVSRREFLKVAGIAGATVGMGAGLGGLVAACGSSATTTTGATTATTIGPATTAGASTTVTAAAKTGREIKLGFVMPHTGGLASFGIPDTYCVTRWTEAIGDGMVLGDGQKHPISITVSDSQSDSNRAAQVAGDLINNTNIDVMMVASTADTVVPVADQCEAAGVPCWATDVPWESFFYGRKGDPKVGFKWTYDAFVGFGDVVGMWLDVFPKLPTNKVIGWLSENNVDGNTAAQTIPPVLEKAGYKVINAGLYQGGTEDFSSIISAFKKAGTQIVAGPIPQPGDFATFWKQAIQQSLIPIIAEISAALLFPESVVALGNIGYGLCTDAWWAPSFPFKSSLTGETCQEVADDYEKRTNQEWTQPLMHYILFELVADALKRAQDVESKESIIEAVKTTKLDTLGGPVDLTSADPNRLPVPNVYATPDAAGQWVKGTKWPYDIAIIGNARASMVPLTGTLQPLSAFPAYKS